ncbi:unnamed protein product [Urochloa humidicola]
MPLPPCPRLSPPPPVARRVWGPRPRKKTCASHSRLHAPLLLLPRCELRRLQLLHRGHCRRAPLLDPGRPPPRGRPSGGGRCSSAPRRSKPAAASASRHADRADDAACRPRPRDPPPPGPRMADQGRPWSPRCRTGAAAGRSQEGGEEAHRPQREEKHCAALETPPRRLLPSIRAEPCLRLCQTAPLAVALNSP